MALTQRTRVREVLIVQSDDDLTWHAHQMPITEILDGSNIISATYGDAQPLAIGDIEGTLSQAFIDITNERDTFKVTVAEREATISDLEAKLADVQSKLPIDEPVEA